MSPIEDDHADKQMNTDEHSPKRRKLSPPVEDEATSSSTVNNNVNTRGSWYGKSWSRKSLPVTQVAKESISSASNTALETASIIREKITPVRRSSSLALTRRSTSKALPLDATTTKDHAMPESRRASRSQSNDDGTRSRSQSKQSTSEPNDAKKADGQKKNADISEGVEALTITPAPRSWIGWMVGGDGTPASSMSAADVVTDPDSAKKAIKTTEPTLDGSEASKHAIPATQNIVGKDKFPKEAEPTIPAGHLSQRRSWIPLWNNSAASQSAPIVSVLPADVKMSDANPSALTANSNNNKDAKSSDDTECRLFYQPVLARTIHQQNQEHGYSFLVRNLQKLPL